ncbi:MAG TPA: universal stress protein, partial [bacterium]|nr:universal stress protein [bacterium]
ALLNHLAGDRFEVASAGLEPGTLNPLAVEAMRQVGLDISQNKTKSIKEILNQGRTFDTVITLCDEGSACPVIPGVQETIHWSFPDPAGLEGTWAQRLAKTGQIRDALKEKLEAWIAKQGGTMLTRVLVATDLSPASFVVTQCVGGLKVFGVKECLLVQCVGVLEGMSLGMAQARDLLVENLQDQKRILEEQGLVTSVEVVPGFPYKMVNRLAVERNCSLIIVGSHGHTLAGDVLLGGAASEIIQHAVRPVLIIRLSLSRETGQVRIESQRCHFQEHILFPTDFSRNADYAFTYLKEMVSHGVKQVTLVHVQDKNRLDPHLLPRLNEFNEIDRGRLEKMKQELTGEGKARIEIEIPFGVPIQELLRLIRERDVQMVLMGSQGRGFIQEVFLGSVSHAMARLSPAPVLLVPAKR